ncbi:YSIRK-type signal peptide-containing protein, partial [Enterococcus faecalis]
MFSKNNQRMILKKIEQRKPRYSIKKLSVGVSSVLIGICIGFGGAENGNAQVVGNSENHTAEVIVSSSATDKAATTEVASSSAATDKATTTEVASSSAATDKATTTEVAS